jgi:hypothetical protein
MCWKARLGTVSHITSPRCKWIFIGPGLRWPWPFSRRALRRAGGRASSHQALACAAHQNLRFHRCAASTTPARYAANPRLLQNMQVRRRCNLAHFVGVSQKPPIAERWLLLTLLSLHRNLIPLFIRPLRLVMPSERVRAVRILLLRLTHFPFVVAIWIYEACSEYLHRSGPAANKTMSAMGRPDSLASLKRNTFRASVNSRRRLPSGFASRWPGSRWQASLVRAQRGSAVVDSKQRSTRTGRLAFVDHKVERTSRAADCHCG